MSKAREVGPYRHDVIEAAGVRVSTIVRESSAMEYASPYYETMVFWLDRTPAILWQSAAGHKRAADRMHDLAVRWFSRALTQAALAATKNTDLGAS